MAIKFLETDAQTVYETVLTNLTDELDEPLYPGDERRIFGEALAMVLMLIYNDLNDAGKQKALRYASGEVLDALGERVGVTRIEPTAAQDTFRFSIDVAQASNVTIPQGTRVTQDGVVYFATDSVAIINAGETFVDVGGTCQETGEDYNGIQTGAIKTMVDLIPFVSSVENLYGTAGGDNGEEYNDEGDEKLRERIRLANAAFSVAGPEEAYKYHVLSASPDIIDAYIESPSANVINIYPLLIDGELPDDDTINAVNIALDDDVRPMTDKVNVLQPEQVGYDIEIKYYCTRENLVDAVNLMETEGGAIDSYIEWQCGALGRDISPDSLRRLALSSTDNGVFVERLDITAPVFTEVENNAVAKFSGNLTVSHEIIS